MTLRRAAVRKIIFRRRVFKKNGCDSGLGRRSETYFSQFDVSEFVAVTLCRAAVRKTFFRVQVFGNTCCDYARCRRAEKYFSNAI